MPINAHSARRLYSSFLHSKIFDYVAPQLPSIGSRGLTEEQRQIRSIALEFARNELSPNMQRWDREQHFPIETLKKAAQLGFSGIYVSDKWGGIGMGRLEASLIFEALSQGCVSTSAYLSIHK